MRTVVHVGIIIVFAALIGLGIAKAQNYCGGLVAVSSATPTPGAGPTPIPLASPVVVIAAGQQLKFLNGTPIHGVGTCTTVGNASTDDSACVQDALNNGDVEVKPGVYQIGTTSGTELPLTMPSNRNIRGCTDPNGDCSSTIANYCPSGSTNDVGSIVISPCKGRPVAAFQNLRTNGLWMFKAFGTTGSSVYGMQIREVNYNVNSPLTCQESVGGGAFYGNPMSHMKFYFNDFNGCSGFNGSLELIVGAEGGAANTSDFNDIEYNTFEHGGRGIEISAGQNNLASHNLSVDTSEAGEMLSTCEPNSNNIYDHETVQFVFGSRASQCCAILGGCGSNQGNYNNLTVGISCHNPADAACNTPCTSVPSYYSTDQINNSLCGSSSPSAWFWLPSGAPFNATPSQYSNDTLTGACTKQGW